MSVEIQKKEAAKAALDYIEEDSIVGVGTGSTVNFFIDALVGKKHLIEGAVASSEQTKHLLKEKGIPLLDTNAISQIDVYVDGADQANKHLQLIKGGGAALTGEKVINALSKKFICIIDQSKLVDVLGSFPLPIEVLSIARSYVARELVKLGGDPAYREGVVTDYGNIILDVHNLHILEPKALEEKLNQITGIVTNGLFAKKPADLLIIGKEQGVDIIHEK